eukprot:COSAG04_NODE_258_length_18740_cov_15.019312_8_plen_462_part_00
MHDVALNETDMCVGPFWLTSERQLMSAFTGGIYHDVFSLITRSTRGTGTFWDRIWKQANWRKPFEPFTPAAWCSICVCTVMMSLVMVCISRPPIEQHDDVDSGLDPIPGKFAGSTNDVNTSNIIKMRKEVNEKMEAVSEKLLQNQRLIRLWEKVDKEGDGLDEKQIGELVKVVEWREGGWPDEELEKTFGEMKSDKKGKVNFQGFSIWQQKHESTQEYKAAKLRRKKKLEMERRGAILTRGKPPKNQQQQSADEGSNVAGNTANANSLAGEWDVEISWRANKWIMEPAYSLFLGFLGLLVNAPEHDHDRGGAASKVVKLSYAFFTVIVFASYTACLTALLVANDGGSTITIELLEADKTSRLCLMSAAKSDFMLWRPSFDESRLVVSNKIEDSLKQLQNEDCDAFFHHEGAWSQIRGLTEHCNLTSSYGSNFTIMNAMPVRPELEEAISCERHPLHSPWLS